MTDAQVVTTKSKSVLFGWWPKATKTERYLRHAVALIVWTYSVCQLIVFDMDGFLIRHLPQQLSWVIEFKLLVLLCVLATLFLTVSTKRLLAWTIYIVFYPITRFGWLLLIGCYLVIKTQSWPVLFTALNVLLSTFTSAKFVFVAFVFAATSLAIVLTSTASGSLWFATAVSLLLVVALVAKRFITIFRPSQLLGMYAKLIAVFIKLPQVVVTNDPSIKLIPPDKMTPEQLSKRSSNLRLAIILDELCSFLICKFQAYRRSALPAAFYLLNFFLLIAVVMLLFAIANMGLYQINGTWFSISDGHDFFDFFYYSFSTIFLQRIPEIVPVATATRSVWMMETAFAFVLGGMLISLFFAVKRDIDDNGTVEAVGALRVQSQAIEKFVRTEYSLTLEQALEELERYQQGLGGFIKLLRKAAGRELTVTNDRLT
jgi:hypothetical protein